VITNEFLLTATAAFIAANEYEATRDTTDVNVLTLSMAMVRAECKAAEARAIERLIAKLVPS
jgi:hypothetical protein